MAKNLNIQNTLVAWTEITILNWQAKIDALGIADTYELSQSFIHHIVSSAGGDIAKIEFAFNYYGKFVDMGVGRGVTLADVGISNRKPRKWYGNILYSEVKKLTELLAAKYARKGQLAVIENVKNIK